MSSGTIAACHSVMKISGQLFIKGIATIVNLLSSPEQSLTDCDFLLKLMIKIFYPSFALIQSFFQTKSQIMATPLDIPNEIWEKIIFELNQTDKMKMFYVCKKTKQIAETDRLWTDIVLGIIFIYFEVRILSCN